MHIVSDCIFIVHNNIIITIILPSIVFLNNTIIINFILQTIIGYCCSHKVVVSLTPNYLDLEITHEIDSQFYVAEVKDMVNIVQRLIADGKFLGIKNLVYFVFYCHHAIRCARAR